MSGFRQASQEPEQEREHGLCKASGCRLRGTTDKGGDWLCFAHANSPDWRATNDALRSQERIVFAIDQVLAMSDAEWSIGGWQKLDAFFAQPPFKPTEAERVRRRWYEYRMRQWLLHLAGSCQPPTPRELTTGKA